MWAVPRGAGRDVSPGPVGTGGTMDLRWVSTFVLWALVISLSTIAAGALYRIVGGRVGLSGLIAHKAGDELEMSRLQMLAATLLVAVGYLIASLAQDPAQGLPDIPAVVLLGLAGSHTAYLGGKMGALGGLRGII